MVGDDDQLIYGWRSADPRGILEFHERMPPRPWSATYTLATNYRCSRVVVESAARLVANNTVREAKDVRPREGAAEGALHFAGAPAWPARAESICAFLRSERSRLGCDWRDLAVLCRYRSQQLAVALALDAGSIPRTPALAYRLFSHPAAALLRAYIDLARAPDEMTGDRLRTLLNRPNRYLTTATVEAIATAARPWAHLRALAAREPVTGAAAPEHSVRRRRRRRRRLRPARGRRRRPRRPVVRIHRVRRRATRLPVPHHPRAPATSSGP